VTYTPINLGYSTTYSITIGTGAKDMPGNNILSAFNWQVTTEPKPEINLIKNGGFESGTASWMFYTMVQVLS